MPLRVALKRLEFYIIEFKVRQEIKNRQCVNVKLFSPCNATYQAFLSLPSESFPQSLNQSRKLTDGAERNLYSPSSGSLDRLLICKLHTRTIKKRVPYFDFSRQDLTEQNARHLQGTVVRLPGKLQTSTLNTCHMQEGNAHEKLKADGKYNASFNHREERRSSYCDYKMKHKSVLLCEDENTTEFNKQRVEFGGGAELLFDGVKKHQVTLPGQEEPWDIRNLLVWIKKNLLKERPELFIQGDSVRPGILVLINDADWELLGELDYQLQDQDSILFISTLHGG
eukprot:bmy_08148T0